MKLSRPVAAAIGVAVVAVSGLAIAAPASAATPGVTYITAAQVGYGLPTSVGWNLMQGLAPSSGLSGLTVPDHPILSYGLPVAIDATTGTALQEIGSATTLALSSYANSYALIYIIDALNNVNFISSGQGASFNDLAGTWYDGVGSIAGLSSGTLEDFDDALSVDPGSVGTKVIGIGMFYNDVTVTVHTFTVNGEKFSFMPEPVVTGAPATITQAAYGSTGWSVTASGFVPLETVSVYVSTPGLAGFLTDATADVGGVAAFTWTGATATEAVGAYEVTLVAEGGSLVDQRFSFTVTGALAATGVEATVPLVGAGVLVLGGAALALVAAKRRKRA